MQSGRAGVFVYEGDKVKRKLRQKIKISESDIKKLTRDYMRIKGWFIFPILQGLGAYKGISDFIAIKAGRTVYIENKSSVGKQRPGQIDFQADIEAHGGEYFLVDCYEDLVKID